MATDTVQTCKKGSQLILYYNTGSAETPTWVVHLGVIEDLTMNETEELQELTGRRVSREVKEYNEGEIELSISGTQITDPDYEGWQYLNAVRAGGISREFMCLTGPVTAIGSYGWRGDFRNSERTFNGPATGSMTNPFNLQPAAECHDAWSEPRVVKVIDDTGAALVDSTNEGFDPTVPEAVA